MRSNSKQAKEIIRHHIFGFYDDLEDIKGDANSHNAGRPRQVSVSDYAKAVALVEAGCFLCYTNDIEHFLVVIYGGQVAFWSATKSFNVYKHLIGREIASMIKEHSR